MLLRNNILLSQNNIGLLTNKDTLLFYTNYLRLGQFTVTLVDNSHYRLSQIDEGDSRSCIAVKGSRHSLITAVADALY